MAYVSQELKAKLSPKIKAICKKYKVKATLAVRHHSTLVLNIKEGPIDFISNFNEVCGKNHRGTWPFQPATGSIDVNRFWYHEHFSGKALKFLKEVIPALLGPDYFDHSDAQTDYFHCSHYIDINIGKWDRPYALVK